MNKQLKKATTLNIIINTFLTILNLSVGFIFSSFSLISKGIESIQDILTAIIIHFTVKINNKKPDQSHPFGHTRAENIAAYTIGIIMLFLSLEIITTGIEKLILQETPKYSSILLYTIFIALILKLFLYYYIKNILKTHQSPALKANIADHLNDIFMYIGIFIVIIGLKFNYYFLDALIGILIGFIILYSASKILKENLTYLMGKSANKELENKIKQKAFQISEVKQIKLLKTQHLGSKIQVEIHVAFDKNLKLKPAHTLANKVRTEILKLDEVISCFVHIDPY